MAGHVFTVLAMNSINIEMISQGASEINIGCVVNMKDADRAVQALHSDVICKPHNGIASPLLRSPKRSMDGVDPADANAVEPSAGGLEKLSPAAAAAVAAQRTLQTMPPLSLDE